MYELVLRGSPAQMGATHGALLRGLPPLPFDSRWKALAAACEEECRRHVPEYIEETEALAAAAGVEPASFKAFTLCASLNQTLPSCSVVAILPERSATGKLIVGRNYMLALWDDKRMVRRTLPAQRMATTLCRLESQLDVFLAYRDLSAWLAANNRRFADAPTREVYFADELPGAPVTFEVQSPIDG